MSYRERYVCIERVKALDFSNTRLSPYSLSRGLYLMILHLPQALMYTLVRNILVHN